MKEGDSRIRRFYLFRALTSFALWMPFWTLWAYEKLDSVFLITVVDAAFWTTMIGFQIPAGLISDKYGRRAALLLGEVLFSVGVLTFGLSTEFWQYIASNFIWALGVCFIVSGDTPFMYDTLLELKRANEFTVVMFNATVVMYVTNAVACAIGGLLVQQTGRLDLPLIIAPSIAIMGSMTVFALKEPKVDRSSIGSYRSHLKEGLKHVRNSRAIIILILFLIVIEVGVYVMMIFRSIYMYEDLDLDYLTIGLLICSFLIVGAVIIRFTRKIEEILGEKGSLLFLYAAVFVSFVVVFVVRAPVAIVTQYPIYVVAGIQGPIIFGYINQRVDSEHRSTIVSIATFMFTAVLVAVEVLAGFLASAWGLIESLFVLTLATAPIAVILLLLWSREIDREKKARLDASWERTALD
ncbi:MAG: MFS transporter [Methanobacteriota archaeon]|nr:MAG: MFS transporter [Euryarchaeota archaeon]